MLIAVPSFSLLYSMDEIIDPALTLKAMVTSGTGHMNILIMFQQKVTV